MITATEKFTEIKFGSGLFLQELRLRNKFLRQPIGLGPVQIGNLQNEKEHRHFGWLSDEGKLIACAVVAGNDDIVQLGQMVVAPNYQNQKVGKKLICKIEDFMINKGAARIELNAQISAQGFYQKLRYQEMGEEFELVGVPHIRMFRNLLCSTC